MLIKVEDFQQNKRKLSGKYKRYAPLIVGFSIFITMPKYIQNKKPKKKKTNYVPY